MSLVVVDTDVAALPLEAWRALAPALLAGCSARRPAPRRTPAR